MPDLQTFVEDLHKRVTKLERGQHRPRRRVTNQKGAAEYLNRSREWLRQQDLRGTGPKRLPNGNYTFAALDEYLEQTPTENPDPRSASPRVGWVSL